MQRFSKENLPGLYDDLAQRDKDLEKILLKYGYPPVWVRPNSFETLVLTILEQQVSLASAFAAYKKLKERIAITPGNFLLLNDDQLRACYFSRQKIGYVRILANAIHTGEVDLDAFETLPDDEVRVKLKS